MKKAPNDNKRNCFDKNQPKEYNSKKSSKYKKKNKKTCKKTSGKTQITVLRPAWDIGQAIERMVFSSLSIDLLNLFSTSWPSLISRLCES